MGFRPALTRILEKLPKQRRTGLFSATQTREVKELGRAGLRNPSSVSVAVRAQAPRESALRACGSTGCGGSDAGDEEETRSVAGSGSGVGSKRVIGTDLTHAGHSTVGSVMEMWGLQATPSSLTNYYAVVNPSMKPLLLLRFLHHHRHEKVMVFFLTCAAVDFWEHALRCLPRELIALAVEETALSVEKKTADLCAHWTAAAENGRKRQLRDEKAKKKGKSRNGGSPVGNGLRILSLHGRMVQKKRSSVFGQFRAVRSVAGLQQQTSRVVNDGGHSSEVLTLGDQNDASSSSSPSSTTADGSCAAESKGAVLLCTDIAARGLDVPDVDWIVQFDAPQEPAAFVHRVGRAGRAGRQGASLVLLDPKEDAYVEFLSLRKVPLCPYRGGGSDFEAWWAHEEVIADGTNVDDDVKDGNASEATRTRDGLRTEEAHALAAISGGSKERESAVASVFPIRAASLQENIRAFACCDRELLERGSRAFMAHVRAYKEHRCEFIFRSKSLDVQSLANAFALVKLPKISELRGLQLSTTGGDRSATNPDIFRPLTEFSTETVPYLDKSRERARQKRLVLAKEAFAAQKKLKEERAAAWRSQAAKLKSKNGSGGSGGGSCDGSGAASADRSASFDAISRSNKSRNLREDGPRKRKGKHEALMEEWNELAREERLYKKLRKGKITQIQYDCDINGEGLGGDGGEDG